MHDDDKRLQAAAGIYGCMVDDLMSYRHLDDGAVVIIAPTGQKFIYPAAEIDAMCEEMTPKREAPAAKKAAAKKASAKK